MQKQIPLSDHARADERQDQDDSTREVLNDLAYQRHAIVNVVYYGFPRTNSRDWVLIDTGVAGSEKAILRAARERFDSHPSAIVLTHGHFDHIGAVEKLAQKWNVPVYIHPLEKPYVDGTASYPPPDPKVGGGLMSTLSRFYPRGPIDLSSWLCLLPQDGSVPFMPGWRWIHTPGHTPGHVALWREDDRTLIAADAFVTTTQESAYAAAVQRFELHGPPMYFTQDWEKARESVQLLASLEPELAITGHGRAARGNELREALKSLARDFRTIAMPDQGRYIDDPARVESGTAYAPADG